MVGGGVLDAPGMRWSRKHSAAVCGQTALRVTIPLDVGRGDLTPPCNAAAATTRPGKPPLCVGADACIRPRKIPAAFHFYTISIPAPLQKEKTAIFTGGLQFPVQNAKKLSNYSQKICRSRIFELFLNMLHNLGVQLFCTSTNCINGVQKLGCKLGISCSMLKTPKGSRCVDPQKYEEICRKRYIDYEKA